MSKKNKRPAVDVCTIDDLAVFSDDDLIQRFSYMSSEAAKRDSSRAAAYEIEAAYVQRELQIRAARKQAHRQYLDALKADEVDESSLPEYTGNTMPAWLFY